MAARPGELVQSCLALGPCSSLGRCKASSLRDGVWIGSGIVLLGLE